MTDENEVEAVGTVVSAGAIRAHGSHGSTRGIETKTFDLETKDGLPCPRRAFFTARRVGN